MNDAIQEIRVRAEILHKRTVQGDPEALRRFRGMPRRDPSAVRRRDCLTVLAREMGFPNWPQARQVLGGHVAADFGGLLWTKSCAVFLNLWYKTHGEAAAIQKSRGGYLLAYRQQFFLVDREYVATLGLDPDDPDWILLGSDWTRDGRGCAGARARLYARLVAALPPEQPPS